MSENSVCLLTDRREVLASCLECLAFSFIAAVRVGAGAAYVDLACGTFAVVLVVNTVVYVAMNTVNSFLLHCVSLLPQQFVARVLCAKEKE